MAAGRSPFSEVPPKTDCQPRHRPRRGHAPRAAADRSAWRLNQTGPLTPHRGRLATRAGEAVRTEAVSHPSSFACGIRHRFRPGRSPGTRRLERRPGALRPVTTTIASRLRQVRLTHMGLDNARIGQPPVPATQTNLPPTIASRRSCRPSRTGPSRTVTTWPRRLSRAENAGCSTSRLINVSNAGDVSCARVSAGDSGMTALITFLQPSRVSANLQTTAF
jgi:hypothetical protein